MKEQGNRERQIEMVRRALNADLVEVVRCKDCKYYSEDGICDVHSEYEDKYTRGYVVFMNGEDFCSYGERKEQE